MGIGERARRRLERDKGWKGTWSSLEHESSKGVKCGKGIEREERESA